ncbi:MAG: hypothetical protein WC802_05075 [Patescibacteria group bacterium]|jgi:hypothetical protein
MTLTTHVAIGAFIGAVVGEPALGFVLGIASHFLVDMIPHGDTILADRFHIEKQLKVPVAYAATDGAASILLLMFIVANRTDSSSNMAFAAAVTGSVLPDLVLGVAELMRKNEIMKAYYRFHFFFHDYFSRRYGDVKLRYALVAQTIFILIILKFV